MATLLTLSLLSASCGSQENQAGEAQPLSAPDYLQSLPGLSAVAPGSLGIAMVPTPQSLSSPFVLRLGAEVGAKVYYSFAPFAAETEATEYKEPLHLIPPVELWAAAFKDQKLGTPKRLTYGLLEKERSFAEMTAARLPEVASALSAALGVDHSISYEGDVAGVFDGAAIKLDGKVSDWSLSGRRFVRDGQLDVAAELGFIDLSYVQIVESEDAFFVLLACREAPLVSEWNSYGLDFGISGVDGTSFGPGTNFVYRAEIVRGKLSVKEKDNDTPLVLSALSSVFIGDAIEIKVAKQDLPKLEGEKELIVRPWAFDASTGARVTDRMRPIYLRSAFTLGRSSFAAALAGTIDLDFMTTADLASPAFGAAYAGLGATLIPSLERFNQIPFFESGSLPLFYAASEVNGYAGLNASDRGILSTMGPYSSPLEKAQLLAHELAHFQNAINSKLSPRWLQEGMSEWSSERLLYRFYPAKAVHNYLKTLRYGPYFSVVDADKLDEFPLGDWTTAASELGYSKSLMFLNLLEARLGAAVLKKAFQAAVNLPMDTAGFRRFLEHETETDLEDLFAFWVVDGSPAENGDPRKLYQDADGDGLLGLDEETLKTNPDLADTDGDGFTDDEEYFRGMNPLVSAVDPEGALPAAKSVSLSPSVNTDQNDFMRLAGGAGAKLFYSLNPGDSAPAESYDAPLPFFAPYRIAARSQLDEAFGSTVALARPLYVNGSEVATVAPTEMILPQTPHATSTLATDLTFGSDLGTTAQGLPFKDFTFDLPAHLGAYDIGGASVAATSDTVTLMVETKLAPDAFGSFGDYVFTFENVTWNQSAGPTEVRQNAVSLAAGVPYLYTYDALGNESSRRAGDGIEVSFGANLSLAVAKSLLPQWFSAAGEKLICLWTGVRPAATMSVRDAAGCLVYEASGVTRRAVSVPALFGTGTMALDVSMPTNTYTQALADRFLTVGASALRQFETALARPLTDRATWPAHVFPVGGANTSTGFSVQNPGAFLRINTVALSLTTQDYLFVEQLARLHTAALIERQNVARPYWIQEIYIQWLTASALYQIRPSKEVHDHLADRIEDYRSETASPSACNRASQPNDIALKDWSATSSASSTGSVKSMMFALVLDAALGADVMSKVFSTYTQQIPESDGLKALLKTYAPDKTAAIDGFFLAWVDRNSAADCATIRALVTDQDSDGLYLFEEDKLETNPAVADSYLN